MQQPGTQPGSQQADNQQPGSQQPDSQQQPPGGQGGSGGSQSGVTVVETRQFASQAYYYKLPWWVGLIWPRPE